MRQGLLDLLALPLGEAIGHHGQTLAIPAGRSPVPIANNALCQVCQGLLGPIALRLAQGIGHHGQPPDAPAGCRRRRRLPEKSPGKTGQSFLDIGAVKAGQGMGYHAHRPAALAPFLALQKSLRKADHSLADPGPLSLGQSTGHHGQILCTPDRNRARLPLQTADSLLRQALQR